MKTRAQANRDRQRREEWARRIAADQRLEARRAAATQSSITGQIRSIRTIGTKFPAVGRLRGGGVVTAVLPNGRRSRMRITPASTVIREISRLRAALAVAIGRNSRAIATLAAAQANAVKRLTAEQVRSGRALRKRLVEASRRKQRR
jgi:hypothetical protein